MARRPILLTHDGETMTLRAWAARLGVPHATLYFRWRRGRPVPEVLSPDALARDTVLTCRGETRPLKEWAARLGIARNTLAIRVRLRGVEAALFPPAPKPTRRGGGGRTWVAHAGETRTVAVWAERLGITVQALRARLARNPGTAFTPGHMRRGRKKQAPG